MPLATIRECRLQLRLSQRAFAAGLSVSAESYRTSDSGRRVPPDAILAKAQILAAAVEASRLLSLERLAPMVGTHVRTLRAAARDGRLPVTYEQRTTFRQLRMRATLADAMRFRQLRFREHVPTCDRPKMLTWSSVPVDYDRQLRALRAHLGLSQRTLAHRIGAAGKAAVYQWESRKRTPSPILWARVPTLVRDRREVTKATARKAATLLPSATEPWCRPVGGN